MASGHRNQPSAASASAQLKSSTSSVTSVSSIRSSLSSSTNASVRMKSFGTKNAIDTRTENALIKEIYEQFLNCRLCLKAFIRPKTLNCLHTFCEDCLVKYKEAELEGNKYISYSMRSKLSCPICSKKTDLPPGGVRRLPDSFLLSSLNQVVTRVSRSSKSSSSGFALDRDDGIETSMEEKSDSSRFGGQKLWCGICSKGRPEDQASSSSSSFLVSHEYQGSPSGLLGKNQKVIDPLVVGGLEDGGTTQAQVAFEGRSRKEATVECLDCSAKLLCRDCAVMHMSTEVTRNHSLVGIELAREGRLQCADHGQEAVRFYCESCELCVCILCTFNDHKTHKIVTFSERIKVQTQMLEERHRKCKNALSSVRDNLSIITNFEAKVANAEALIREHSREMMRKVKEEEEKSLDELKSFVQVDDVSSFMEQKLHFEQMLTGMESTLKSAEKLIKSKSVEIILMKRQLDEEMKTLLDWTPRDVPERMSAPLFFEASLHDMKLGFLRTAEHEDNTSRCSSFDCRSDANYSDAVESNTSNTSAKDSSSSREVKASPCPIREAQHVDRLVMERCIEGVEARSQVAHYGEETRTKDFLVHMLNDRGKDDTKSSPTNAEVAPLSQSKLDACTNTDALNCDEKSTSTMESILQTTNKALSINTLSTSDKGVCTVNTHVSSAYRDVLDSKSAKLVMVSRGTMTLPECNQFTKHDRASSPFKISTSDKSTMANKAELSEPRDTFCRPGMEGKPKKIIENNPARLDSINEGSDEDRSSGEDAKVTTAKLPKISPAKVAGRLAQSKPLPYFVNQRSQTPNSAVVYPLASRGRPASGFADKIRNSASKISPTKRFLDTGTNTEIVSSHDKSVGTESSRDQTIVGCINILKTVRNRMESIPSPGSMSMENSEVNMMISSSKISEPCSSITSSFEADKSGACFPSKLNDGADGFISREIKKCILSVDAGGQSVPPEENLAKKSKPCQSPVSLSKRQKTPGPAQSADGSNSSGKSSTNNSPGLQRSGKSMRPLLFETSKSPKVARAKLKSIQQDSPLGSKQRQRKSKNSPGLTDLSDSLHSESSEEYDRCGSGESFAGTSVCSTVEKERSFVAGLKQRLVGSPLSCRRQKAELPKVHNPVNKSPRLHRKL